MYIEQKYYDSGKAFVKLINEPCAVDENESCDHYVDESDDLQEWIEDNLEIELDDIIPFVLELEVGKWVEITAYI